MLAAEIIYQTLSTEFNGRVAPVPMPEKFDLQSGVYVTYQKISTMPLDDDANWMGHDQVRMQINVFHNDIIECEHCAAQVRWLMCGQKLGACECVGSRSDFDPETQLYYEQIDFLIWQSVC